MRLSSVLFALMGQAPGSPASLATRNLTMKVLSGQRVAMSMPVLTDTDLAGLILGDAESYLKQDPDWTPTDGTAGAFTIVDNLTATGVMATIP